MSLAELETTTRELATRGKGILAADESTSTMTKRLQSIQVESTEESRRAFRELLFTTPGISEFIGGIILYEETLKQKAGDGTPLPQVLSKQGIVPGIKVDKGTLPLNSSPGDMITQGLDGLGERLRAYKETGARFAKWRAVFPITEHTPRRLGIKLNAEALARYASICQSEGFVPIVEPELLMDGPHTLERCAEATEAVLHSVFHSLHRHHVILEYIVLKPSMVVSGTDCLKQAGTEEVAEATLRILRRTVPAAVQTINFLSGGQSDTVATAHLNAMNASKIPAPWHLSFSYGRALQAPCLKAWQGKKENARAAQQALYRRTRLNGLACLGKYTPAMEAPSM